MGPAPTSGCWQDDKRRDLLPIHKRDLPPARSSFLRPWPCWVRSGPECWVQRNWGWLLGPLHSSFLRHSDAVAYFCLLFSQMLAHACTTNISLFPITYGSGPGDGEGLPEPSVHIFLNFCLFPREHPFRHSWLSPFSLSFSHLLIQKAFRGWGVGIVVCQDLCWGLGLDK